jgi:5,10-methylene-tetrahydrofolate dehydrogenase/methenyl tetrahydrofolate cyclohydrolase
MVSWIDLARQVAQEVQTQEASRSRVSSKMESCQTTGFSSMTEDASSQEDWRATFVSVIDGASNQMDWRAVVVEDPVRETELLSGDDGGWSASLVKREC